MPPTMVGTVIRQFGQSYGAEWGLTWYLRWGIYTWKHWKHWQNPTAHAEAQSSKMSSHLKMITNTIPTSMRIVISCEIRSGNPFWVWRKDNGNWDNNMIKTSYGKKTTVEKILASEETNKSNEQGCESQRQWFK